MKFIFLVILAFGAASRGISEDWAAFGWDVERSSAPSVSMGISAADIGSLRRRQVAIDGVVDGAAIYLGGVEVDGGTHDAFFVTTTYGKTIAVDADSGAVLWEFTPPSYDGLKGTYRITNATPVADADRRFIYAASPDGVIRKLSVANGRVMWSTSITRLPEREKIASPLGFFRGHVIAATDGYIGDRPPYQGHVAVLDAGSGALLAVWNSLGSDRHYLMNPASYPESDSGIWGRAGVVMDSSTGDMYIATGNGLWDGRTNWGDSVIELDAGASRILGNYTPADTRRLNEYDEDLGSTSPVLLGGGLVAQGGKDGLIRLLDWGLMRGDSPHRGGEIARTSTPSGGRLFTAPAVFHEGGDTWLLAADNGGTTAWSVSARGFVLKWHAAVGGTSPVVTDGLAFVYDPRGGLHVYEAGTGRRLGVLECGGGHWNSPIVADGRIALPEGNANSHLTAGILNIWRLPPGPS
jgi:outer membrane protein assembly factor BamB